MAEIVNWSENHRVLCNKIYTPTSDEEIFSILTQHEKNKIPIRVYGSALSPNGISFCPDAMINLGKMNKILFVDKSNKQVKVQAGITIEHLANKLEEFGLTLENFGSIKLQTLGGFTQVGVHGTGISIPPVDCQIVQFKLISPSCGIREFDRISDPEDFHLLRLGLGCFGVVSEITLQCIDAIYLKEETSVRSWDEIEMSHATKLAANRHLRYLWIPYTRSVIEIKSNPFTCSSDQIPSQLTTRGASLPGELNEFQKLLLNNSQYDKETVLRFPLAKIRDELLKLSISDTDWVKKVNNAELDMWKEANGTKIGKYREILEFDCGGRQLVNEFAVQLDSPMKDILLVKEMILEIERSHLAAPAPIEQRWSQRSTSLMSPAFSQDETATFTWVGFIYYFPNIQQREEAKQLFAAYSNHIVHSLSRKYALKLHWAKLELPAEKLNYVRESLRNNFPLRLFNSRRKHYDSNNILANQWVIQLLDNNEETDAREQIVDK